MAGPHASRRRPSLGALWALLGLAFVVVVLVAARVGTVSTTWHDAWTGLAAGLGFMDATDPGARIVAAVRLPRILLAATAGAALGLAGALQSGAFRSPLAAPVTTGGAAGALLGASLALGLAGGGAAALQGVPGTPELMGRVLAATVGAALATWAVLRLARVGATVAVAPLLLAGLAVNALVGALAAVALFLGPVGAQAAATLVVGWSFGGLLAVAQPGAWRIPLAAAAVAAVVAAPFARALDLLLMGEEDAATSGVDVLRLRIATLGGAAVAIGGAVALVGVVAFLGLLAPTLMRPATGPGHRRLLPAAAAAGAVLLVAADAVGRAVAGASDLPAGVVTAALGAPVLMVLLVRGLREVSA